MATIQHFRTALGGFNRQDVVNYIEYLNNQHNAKVQQLNTQLQQYQAAVLETKGSFQDAAAVLYAIRPEEE